MYFITLNVGIELADIASGDSGVRMPAGHFENIDKGLPEKALNAFCFGLTPAFYAVQKEKFNLINGEDYLLCALCFMDDRFAYPETGDIADMRGKLFSELSNKAKKRLRQAKFELTVLTNFSGNQGKERHFVDHVKSII